MSDDGAACVQVAAPDGGTLPVHEYLNGNYALADVAELLQYGELSEGSDGETILTLTRKELRDLQNAINAFSFDYDEGFVELCLDMTRIAGDLPGETIVFTETSAA